MEFNYDLKPTREGLNPTIAAMMDRAFYAGRAAGRNVQFIRQSDGKLDEFSLATVERAQEFAVKLTRESTPFAVSQIGASK